MRGIRVADLQSLGFADAGAEGFRIIAELTCARCGAYQAADSDPAPVKDRLAELTARLFSDVGWRVGEHDDILCPDCTGGIS